MKKFYKTILSLTCLLFLTNQLSAQLAWEKATDYPGTNLQGVYAANANVVNSYAYIAFGAFNSTSGDITSSKQINRYDPSTNSWTALSTFPSNGRYGVASFTLSDNIYYVTGSLDGEPYLNEVWVYNITKNSWIQAAAFPGGGRIHASGFSIGNKGYIFGGATGSTYFDDLWEFDPSTSKWTQKASLPVTGNGRYGAGTFVLNDRAYIVGGRNEPSTYFTNTWEYNPALNQWTQKTSVPLTATLGIGFSLDGIGYYGLGTNAAGYNKAIYTYNATTDKWTASIDFKSTGRYTSVAFVVNSIAYAGLGSSDYLTPTYEKDIWKLINTTAVNDNLLSSAISLFPNPSSEFVDINIENGVSNATVTITSILGQEVQQLSGISGTNQRITTSQLASGLYILTIVENGKMIFKSKLIKE